MKSRLFWKILVGVWAMLLILSLGSLAFTYYYFEANREQVIGTVQSESTRFVNQLALVLHHGGQEALEAFLQTSYGELRKALTLQRATLDAEMKGIRIDPPPRGGDPLEPITATVVAPDGAWRLSFQPSFSEPDYVSLLRYLVQSPINALAVVVSLAFSALLAWYLTRPVQRLRLGLARLAKGDLNTRLDAQSWRRRDEITDLARDFDQVASQLQKLMASREQLLHDVSHELRTPLARLRLAIDLARQSSAEAAQPSLDRIDAESKRIDELVGELLTLARVEADTAQKDQYFDVPALVRTVAEDARLEADPAGVSIETNVERDEPEATLSEPESTAVRGDAELLRRAVENVLRNAIRFSPRGTPVSIAVTKTDGHGASVYSIQIADRGPGVPHDEIGKIFDPFVRVATMQPVNGFGLGLAIARRAVLAHGGTIEARNRTGGGLEVTLRIPFPKAQ